MKKIWILVLSCVFLLTGCSARAREPEESAVVKALAFDKTKDGYEVAAYIAGAEEHAVVSAKGETTAEGILNLNTATERRIFLGKNQVILISSDIRNIEEILLSLYSLREMQKGAKLLIVQGKAAEVLSYRGLSRETASDIEKTVENAAENGNYPQVTLYGGVNSMASMQGCCVLPMAKMNGENLELLQCAVYRDYRILQTLSEEEALGCALLREDDSAFAVVGGDTVALREISVETFREKGENIIRVECRGRYLMGVSGTGSNTEMIEDRLEKAVLAAYGTAQKLEVNFTELYPCDISLPARAEVTVTAASNGYPLGGVKQK